MKIVKIQLKCLKTHENKNGFSSFYLGVFSFFGRIKEFSRTFSGKDNFIPYIFTYFIELLKEPCIVNFHVESENTFEMLNKMKKNDFGHFSDDVCKNKIKKMLTIHRVRFILDKNREVNELENEKTKKNAVKMSGEIPLRKNSPSWHSIQDNVVRRKGKLIVADPSKAVKSEFYKQQMRRKYSDSSEDNQF